VPAGGDGWAAAVGAAVDVREPDGSGHPEPVAAARGAGVEDALCAGALFPEDQLLPGATELGGGFGGKAAPPS
jgi:hypothetical protein